MKTTTKLTLITLLIPVLIIPSMFIMQGYAGFLAVLGMIGVIGMGGIIKYAGNYE